ncbi:three-helix bundle dimerization domain-containing protein [Agromyces sp. NPDC056523]|uniref:three-helix bundle dimerization domain-containing protein n=1 Tax=Agromyces sp. NPDC056523 TaxID=3345850 RepID=UPI00366E2E7D
MDALGENEALDRVSDRLAARFPTLSPEYVRRVVGDERRRLESATVRDFVPAVVEHAATEQLRKLADPVRVHAEDDSSSLGDAGERHDLDPMERERRERAQRGGFLFGDLGGDPA